MEQHGLDMLRVAVLQFVVIRHILAVKVKPLQLLTVMVHVCVSSVRCIAACSGVNVSRRGSCSLEVMAGLRAKCHARSQQNMVISDSTRTSSHDGTSASAATTPTADTPSELPPDILQSCMYLATLHVDTITWTNVSDILQRSCVETQPMS